ncbi:MAG: hypothetical protein HQM09_03455 [Candidatus Riflebacteria bacterium]|nr:hypothetical protein [Candidatus Riflebacteria bacterium]
MCSSLFLCLNIRRFYVFCISMMFVVVGIYVPECVEALDCPVCGAKGISALVMYCPTCKSELHMSETTNRGKKTAALQIEIIYTGDKPDKLPETGRILFNRRPKGEISLVEREVRERYAIPGEKKHGVGIDYTALYRGEIRELAEGVVDVTVEMTFPWVFGLLKRTNRVTFPRVGFKPGETVKLHHTFSHPNLFSQRGETPARKKNILPDLPHLKTATGTLSIELPLSE